MPILDLTRPLAPGMAVWPGDPPLAIQPVTAVADGAAVSRLCLGTHTGTHVDAPAHLFAGGTGVDQLPIEALIGPAWVADAPAGRPATAADLQAIIPPGCQRLLLRGAAGLTADGAQWLVAHGLRLVGTDADSVDAVESEDLPAHRALLAAGVVIVEGLALSAAPVGPCELLCLPLRLVGADGAPARAVMIIP